MQPLPEHHQVRSNSPQNKYVLTVCKNFILCIEQVSGSDPTRQSLLWKSTLSGAVHVLILAMSQSLSPKPFVCRAGGTEGPGTAAQALHAGPLDETANTSQSLELDLEWFPTNKPKKNSCPPPPDPGNFMCACGYSKMCNSFRSEL